jgi:hypothetical protein
MLAVDLSRYLLVIPRKVGMQMQTLGLRRVSCLQTVDMRAPRGGADEAQAFASYHAFQLLSVALCSSVFFDAVRYWTLDP